MDKLRRLEDYKWKYKQKNSSSLKMPMVRIRLWVYKWRFMIDRGNSGISGRNKKGWESDPQSHLGLSGTDTNGNQNSAEHKA